MKLLIALLLIGSVFAQPEYKYKPKTAEDSLILSAKYHLELAIELLNQPQVKIAPYFMDEVDNLKQRIIEIETERMQRQMLKDALKKFNAYLEKIKVKSNE